MFKFVPVRAQLRAVQKRNILLEQEAKQTKANLDFVALMCDVEIPEEEDAEMMEVSE